MKTFKGTLTMDSWHTSKLQLEAYLQDHGMSKDDGPVVYQVDKFDSKPGVNRIKISFTGSKSNLISSYDDLANYLNENLNNEKLSEEIGVFIRVGIVEVDDNKDSLSIDEGYWK